MTGSLVRCVDCGDSSLAVEWGFVLLAQHGWSAEPVGVGAEAKWRCPACQAEGADEASEAQRRLRVLLVDDQVLVLRTTAGMLRELDVVTAGSADEALARLAQGSHFDVIVSDASMPGLNGPELFARVRRQHPQLAERFLLLSGDAYTAAAMCAAVARREGIGKMPKILEKPVPRTALVREIELLGREGRKRSGTYAIGSGQTSLRESKVK